MKIKNLIWTEPRSPNRECGYNHIISMTPFGDFLITWKGWKKYDNPTVDETPWGDWYIVASDLDEAKEMAQLEWERRLKECLSHD